MENGASDRELQSQPEYRNRSTVGRAGRCEVELQVWGNAEELGELQSPKRFDTVFVSERAVGRRTEDVCDPNPVAVEPERLEKDQARDRRETEPVVRKALERLRVSTKEPPTSSDPLLRTDDE